MASDFLFSNTDLNDHIHIIQWIKGNNFNKGNTRKETVSKSVPSLYSNLNFSSKQFKRKANHFHLACKTAEN